MKYLTYIISIINKFRLNVTDEKITQFEIDKALKNHGIPFIKEYRLDANNIPDFFCEGVAIEVKIKGQKIAIYKQCQRYCKFEEVKVLILCTNKAMGFPALINNKPCYYINIGKAWL